MPEMIIWRSRLSRCCSTDMEQFARISHIVIFTGVFQASAEDGTVCPKLSRFRRLCRRLYLIDTLLILVRRTRTVLFCVCKVSLQSFDIIFYATKISSLTVTEALVLHPLLEDRGHITESICILVPVDRTKQKCFQITTKQVRRSQQFQSTLKTILFCSVYRTRVGAFMTV